MTAKKKSIVEATTEPVQVVEAPAVELADTPENKAKNDAFMEKVKAHEEHVAALRPPEIKVKVDNKQRFGRIQAIEAFHGMIVFRVKENNDPNNLGVKLKDVICTVADARDRIEGLRLMAVSGKLDPHVAREALDICKDGLRKCDEASKQVLIPVKAAEALLNGRSR